MDPLTHTLTGAALARTRLGRLGGLAPGLAAGVLIAGANLPDVDVATYFGGGDFALAHRRGWTHGLLAMALLPPLLAGAALAWDRLRHRRRRRRDPSGRPQAPPARFAPLLALAAVAVWSHPLLDWLNTYGVRFLAPFDWRWFYGDSVHIVDPWIWLLLGGALFLGGAAGGRATVGWGVLAALATLLVLSQGPAAARWPWLAGLAVAALARWWAGRRGLTPWSRGASERLASAALAAAALYAGVLWALQESGRALVLDHLGARAPAGQAGDLMVGPRPGDPFRHQVVVATPEGYRLGGISRLGRTRLALEPGVVPRPAPTPAVRAALAAPSVRGFVTWARYPTAVEVRTERGTTVHLIDLRYARRPGGGFGTARVDLGPDLDPRDTP